MVSHLYAFVSARSSKSYWTQPCRKRGKCIRSGVPRSRGSSCAPATPAFSKNVCCTARSDASSVVERNQVGAASRAISNLDDSETERGISRIETVFRPSALPGVPRNLSKNRNWLRISRTRTLYCAASDELSNFLYRP